MRNINTNTGKPTGVTVAGAFDSEMQARQAAIAVRTQLSVGDAQVRLLAPDDPGPILHLRQGGENGGDSPWAGRVKWGLAGAGSALVLAGLGHVIGVRWMLEYWPWLLPAAMVLGATAGLGGFQWRSARSVEDPCEAAVREALASGRFVVLVSADCATQCEQASVLLSARGGVTTVAA